MDGAFGGDLDTGEPPDQTLADLPGTPGGVLALNVQDKVLNLKGKLMGIPTRTPAPVRQPLNAAFPRFCSLSCGRSQTPCRVPPSARRLAGEPQTAVSRPSPNTPSTASLPPKKRGKV